MQTRSQLEVEGPQRSGLRCTPLPRRVGENAIHLNKGLGRRGYACLDERVCWFTHPKTTSFSTASMLSINNPGKDQSCPS